MNNTSGLSDLVLDRVEEAEAIRLSRINAEYAKDRALMAGVCPSCAGQVVKRRGWLTQLLNRCDYIYDCMGCGMAHPYVLAD